MTGEQEYHYFKLNPDIKVRTLDELHKNVSYSCHFSGCPVDRDEEGCIRYIYTKNYFGDGTCCSNRATEERLAKVATRVPVDIAMAHLAAAKKFEEHEQEKAYNAWLQEQAKEAKKLETLYQAQRNDASLFPGVNGNFIHTMPNRIINPNASIE